MPLIHLFLNNFYDEFLISRTFIFYNTTYRLGAAVILHHIALRIFTKFKAKHSILIKLQVVGLHLDKKRLRWRYALVKFVKCLGTAFFIEHLQNQPLDVFYKKAVLKNFAIFTVKQLCWSHFNKVARVKFCNFNEKRLQHRCFSVNIAKF